MRVTWTGRGGDIEIIGGDSFACELRAEVGLCRVPRMHGPVMSVLEGRRGRVSALTQLVGDLIE